MKPTGQSRTQRRAGTKSVAVRQRTKLAARKTTGKPKTTGK